MPWDHPSLEESEFEGVKDARPIDMGNRGEGWPAAQCADQCVEIAPPRERWMAALGEEDCGIPSEENCSQQVIWLRDVTTHLMSSDKEGKFILRMSHQGPNDSHSSWLTLISRSKDCDSILLFPWQFISAICPLEVIASSSPVKKFVSKRLTPRPPSPQVPNASRSYTKQRESHPASRHTERRSEEQGSRRRLG